MRRIIAGSIAAAMLAGPSAGVALASQAASAQEEAAVMQRYVERLPVGTDVKVRLKQGERFRATLIGVEADEVILKPRTRVPEPQRRVRVADVEMIEPQTGGINVAKAIAIGIGAGGASFLGLMLLVFSLAD